MLNEKKAYTICMVAYANYFTDARIKNYVEALLKDGYLVDVFALGKTEQTLPGLHVVSVAKKIESQRALPYLFLQLWFFVLTFFYVTSSFFKKKYRIIHIHNMPDFLVFCAFVPKLFGAKIILDVHDTMPEAFATKMNLPLIHPIPRLLRLQEVISATLADEVITTNDLHRETLIEHGIPPNKISIIMNVGNEAIFYPRFGSRVSRGFTLVYHGTIAARLGVDLILEAIHLVRPSCPNLKFLLIGDGEYMVTVKNIIEKYQLSGIVQLTGWVPVESLPNYLSLADIGIIGNRRYTEEYKNWMLPVKMLEYTAMEVPTITPRLKVIEKYFDDTNALFYESDNVQDMARVICNVYQHPKILKRIVQGLKSFNTRFNWAEMERRYLHLVNRLVNLG